MRGIGGDEKSFPNSTNNNGTSTAKYIVQVDEAAVERCCIPGQRRIQSRVWGERRQTEIAEVRRHLIFFLTSSASNVHRYRNDKASTFQQDNLVYSTNYRTSFGLLPFTSFPASHCPCFCSSSAVFATGFAKSTKGVDGGKVVIGKGTWWKSIGKKKGSANSIDIDGWSWDQCGGI